MKNSFIQVFIAILLVGLFVTSAQAQYMFNYGRDSDDDRYWWWFPVDENLDQPRLRLLAPEVAQNYIMIDGTAEVRIEPEQMRAVLAIVTESEKIKETAELANKKVAAVIKDLKEILKVEDKNVHEDFISFSPYYGSTRISFDEKDPKHRLHHPEYFRYQTNLHVILKSEAEAKKLVEIATAHDIADVASIDYWNGNLDAQKIEARKLAIQAAKEKADLLLAVFDKRPRLINIQESIKTIKPSKTYSSYQSGLERESGLGGPGGVFGPTGSGPSDGPPVIYFLRVPDMEADIRDKRIPLKAEISVVSTVVLYFESPAAGQNAKK